MKPSIVVILALAGASSAGCAGFGFGREASPAKPVAAAVRRRRLAADCSRRRTLCAGCQPIAPAAPVLGATVAASAGAVAAAAAQSPAAAVPARAALGGVLGGPVGASLTEADWAVAWKAQIAALDSGQRRSWRGVRGVFGFVEPGSETGGGCRAYSQTIYVSGRPNRGQGVACKQADGTWRMTS